jgi:hypothetical protein
MQCEWAESFFAMREIRMRLWTLVTTLFIACLIATICFSCCKKFDYTIKQDWDEDLPTSARMGIAVFHITDTPNS